MKKLALWTLLLFPVVTVALLGFALEGYTAEMSGTLTNIRFSFNKNAGQTPQYVADTRGFFKKYGLKVERIEFNNNPDMVAALDRGHLEMMASIPGSPLSAREQGYDLVAFMQNETSNFAAPDSGALIARRGSGVKSVADLKGKIVACLYLSSQDCIDSKYVIKKAGVDLKSITFIEANFGTHFDLLRSGQVDAVSTVNPFTTQILTKGAGDLLAWNYIESNPGQPLGAWWAKKQWVTKNPQVARAFQRAIKDAIDFLRQDKVRAREVVAEYTGLDKGLLTEMAPLNWNYHVDPQAWQQEAKILVEMGALQKMPKPEEYFAEQIKEYFKK